MPIIHPTWSVTPKGPTRSVSEFRRAGPATATFQKTEKGQSLQSDRANTAAAPGQPSKFTRLRTLLSRP